MKKAQNNKVNKKVRVLVFAGYGLNCEEEAAYGFTLVGAKADIVHINDVIDGKMRLDDYHILCLPGGFAYGDDTGAGKAYANRVRNHLGKQLGKFLKDKKLVIGICNGFQILTQIGLLPGALTFNDNNRYTDRWVDMKVVGKSPWLNGITTISSPIAHGEGKYIMPKGKVSVALEYVKGETAKYQDLAANPNGSMKNIAGVLSHEGRVFGLMPHPDRALFATQLPQWPLLKENSRPGRAGRSGEPFPEYGPGLQIFRNGVEYFLK